MPELPAASSFKRVLDATKAQLIRGAIFWGFCVGVGGTAGSIDAHAAKLVGIGAASCSEFLQDAQRDVRELRTYLAWAQGYMSAIVMSAPAGVDDELDLASTKMPLAEQIAFVVNFCNSSPQRDYVDALHALYRNLGGMALR